MADVVSQYIVRTNIHRKKIADKCVHNTGDVDRFDRMAFGSGGKTSTGTLKVPNGAVPQLFNQVKILPLDSFEKVNDFEYIAKITIDTTSYPDLVGVDVNERAIVDSSGVFVVLETFAGFGPLQANKTYEYALRFTVI